jgi:iron complex transport system ATP-binding protein
MLRANAISFGYDTREVLHQVSVCIHRGSLTGIIGPNGSGKTTLLRLLSGVYPPATGQVTLEDQDLASYSRKILARRLTTVQQQTETVFEYTVLEIVLMGRYPHLRSFEIEGPLDLELATQALAATGTSELASRAFSTLSGGEKQRVVIASALAQLSSTDPTVIESNILLLDEPTTSLDLNYQLEIGSLLQKLNGAGITTVVSTHDLNLAASVCRDLIVLRDGEVIACGKTGDILTEETVRLLYGVSVQVTHNSAAGHLVVIPIR